MLRRRPVRVPHQGLGAARRGRNPIVRATTGRAAEPLSASARTGTVLPSPSAVSVDRVTDWVGIGVARGWLHPERTASPPGSGPLDRSTGRGCVPEPGSAPMVRATSGTTLESAEGPSGVRPVVRVAGSGAAMVRATSGPTLEPAGGAPGARSVVRAAGSGAVDRPTSGAVTSSAEESFHRRAEAPPPRTDRAAEGDGTGPSDRSPGSPVVVPPPSSAAAARATSGAVSGPATGSLRSRPGFPGPASGPAAASTIGRSGGHGRGTGCKAGFWSRKRPPMSLLLQVRQGPGRPRASPPSRARLPSVGGASALGGGRRLGIGRHRTRATGRSGPPPGVDDGQVGGFGRVSGAHRGRRRVRGGWRRRRWTNGLRNLAGVGRCGGEAPGRRRSRRGASHGRGGRRSRGQRFEGHRTDRRPGDGVGGRCRGVGRSRTDQRPGRRRRGHPVERRRPGDDPALHR